MSNLDVTIQEAKDHWSAYVEMAYTLENDIEEAQDEINEANQILERIREQDDRSVIMPI